jgi:hypothetical protein
MGPGRAQRGMAWTAGHRALVPAAATGGVARTMKPKSRKTSVTAMFSVLSGLMSPYPTDVMVTVAK